MAKPLKRSTRNLCTGDFAMPLTKISVAEVRAHLHAEYTAEQMRREVKMWQARVARNATPLQRYVNSTSNRAMTARLLAIAAYDAANDDTYLGVTKQECANVLGVSLNAASTIVTHYVAEGWAVAHKSSGKHFQATPEHTASAEDYAQMILDLTPSSLWSNHQKLMDFDQITTSHLDFTDDS